MKVLIKDFSVEMPVKSKGIEFEVKSTKDEFLGDCILTMSGLTWCKGKKSRENGADITWDNFIALMESPEILTIAIKDAKKARKSAAAT